MQGEAENDEVVMTLVAAALQRVPAEREAYLRSACQDSDTLFEATWQRVQWEERMGSFLLEPLIPRQNLEHPFRPGDVLSDRFKVIREVAHGGMGVVYEAVDQRLNRPIAIKCARPGYRGRLPPEARNAREISHRNVCKLHDIHTCRTEFGEVDFLSMEFLEGEALAERIRRDGPLLQDELREISRQILAGLEAAHAKGVVHGDLKSNNILLTKESGGALRAVITDFGLARPVDGAAHEAAGGVGSSAMGGTVEYMAPELLKGQRASIAADLYAFGVILHEMVVGSRPQSPSRMAPGLPRRWKRVIARCLEPEPAQRFAGARQALDSLDANRGRWAWAALLLPFLFLLPPVQHKVEAWFAPPPVRLAVLPFEADAETTSRASGLLHDVSDRLASLGANNFLLIPLTDTSRNNVRTLEQAKTVSNATHALLGKMQKRADTLAVSAAVTEVDSRRVVTELTHEYKLSELALVAKALTGSVTAGLHLRGRIRAEAVDPLAYPYYVEAVHYLRRDAESADSAIGLFEKAIQLDPNSALPYAGLAESQLQNYKRKKGRQWLDLAQASVDKAEARNPDAVQVRLIAGLLGETLGVYDKAAGDYGRAIELDSKIGEGYRRLGYLYQLMNKPAEALATYRKAIEAEPSYYRPYFDLASFHFYHGQYRQAEAEYRRVIDLAPELAPGHTGLGVVLTEMGRYAEAETEYRTALRLQESPFVLNNLGALFAYMGRDAEAAQFYERGINKGASSNVLYMNLADSYRRLQRPAEAEAAYRKELEVVEHELVDDPHNGYVRSILAYTSARLGDTKRAELEIAQALKFFPNNAKARRYAALTYEALNERDKTLEVLASAAPDLLSELNRQPDLAALRQDSRFLELLRSKSVH
jgi:serine/threonine protein kinase/Flp pilus assembly protein TadD